MLRDSNDLGVWGVQGEISSTATVVEETTVPLCPIMDALYPERQSEWKPLHDRSSGPAGQLPNVPLGVFSFHDAPNRALSALRRLAIFDAKRKEYVLGFGSEDSLYITDIAPFMVLDAMNADFSLTKTGSEVPISVRKVLQALDIRTNLFQPEPANHSPNTTDDLWVLPLERRQRNVETSPDIPTPPQESIAADRLVEQINSWLTELDFRLNPMGEREFRGVCAEILNNACRHADPINEDGDWSMAAFMARRTCPRGTIKHYCYLGFFSLGATIAQNIENARDENIRERAERYCRAAQAPHLTEDVLRTVLALQDGVTRDKRREDGGVRQSGGYGMMKLISLVDRLGSKPIDGEDPNLEPKVTLVSGNAWVQAKRPHLSPKLAVNDDQSGGNSHTYELWFNEQQNEGIPPSENHARRLDHSLPGTVISVAFILDPQYLMQSTEDD